MDKDTTLALQRLINAHVAMFGSKVAIGAVKNVKGLQVSQDGKIEKITGDPKDALLAVVGSYFPVSGNLSYQIINPVVSL